jgi:hypothetical protein
MSRHFVVVKDALGAVSVAEIEWSLRSRSLAASIKIFIQKILKKFGRK